MQKYRLLTILLIILTSTVAHSGWSQDQRLTYRGCEIEPQVIARNDTVHVAWQEVAGPERISYIQSADGGNNWNNIVDLTEMGHLGAFPSLSLSSGRAFIGWFDEDTNPINWVSNIGYSYSNNGHFWEDPAYVFPQWSPRGYGRGSLALNGDSIYVAYLPWIADSLGNQLVFFKHSSDLGNTWSDSEIIGRTPEYLNGFNMKKCGNSLYVVWSGEPFPNGQMYEILVVVSQDGGETWLEPVQLSSEDNWAAQYSCIACDESNGNVAVGWMDYGQSHGFPGDLYLRITIDGGNSWGNELHATTDHTASVASLSMAGDTIWAVWQDIDRSYGTNNNEIAFTKSTNFGQTWIPRERLTYAAGFSNTPWISYDDGKIHVVWWEVNRPPSNGEEIYYKKWEPDVGIGDEVSHTLPEKIILSAYPNPFNSNTIITFNNPEGGDSEIRIYDPMGRQLRAFNFIGEKEGQIKWDATDASGKKVSSGIYFAKARTSHNSQVIKLIYLK